MSRKRIPVNKNVRNSSHTVNHSLLRDRRYLFCLVLITCAILLTGGLLWNNGARPLTIEKNDATVEPWYRGPDNAPVTVSLYPDFLCGICVIKERMAIRIAEDFGDKVRLVYHHYPSSRISELIAESLEAAGEQGQFWELHDRLIDDTDKDIYQVVSAAMSMGLDVQEYALSKIITESEAIGLNINQLIEAIDSGRFTQKVRTARQEAISAGVTTTSVFINSKIFEGISVTYEDFYTAVAGELEKSSDR